MDKPTREDIKNFVKNLPYRNFINSNEPSCIESFSLHFRYKYDANGVARSINREFGGWVNAMVIDTHVSIGYRLKELK